MGKTFAEDVADRVWQTLEDQGVIPPEYIERDSGLNLWALILADAEEAMQRRG